MTTKATDNQWAQVKSWAELGSSRDACVVELLARVDALEDTIRRALEQLDD